MDIELFEQLLKIPESETVDFKSKFYPPSNNADMLKDVISFANGHSKESKYIIYGVKERENTIKLIGLESFVDQSNLEQLIFENVEPHPDFKLHSILYKDKKFHVLEINSIHRPYMLKKNTKTFLIKA